MTETRSVALLEVSPAAYEEISGALQAAGYEGQAFAQTSAGAQFLDMNGVALCKGEALAEERATEWTPCATRLSLPLRIVIVANASNRWWAQREPSHDDDVGIWRCAATGIPLLFIPTHWQDMPPLPEEEGKGENSLQEEERPMKNDPTPAPPHRPGLADPLLRLVTSRPRNALAIALIEWRDAGGNVLAVTEAVEDMIDERIAAAVPAENRR
jgi:hypothetical protein